jgi:hypothetical protein
MNREDALTCGVCGGKLSETGSPRGPRARLIEDYPVESEEKLSKTGIVVFLFGIGLTMLGTVGMFLIGSLGLAILVAGLFFVMVGADSAARDPSRSMHILGDEQGAYLEQVGRKEAEEKKRESGAAD